MKSRFLILLVLAMCMFFESNSSFGASIWAKRPTDMRRPYADDVARRIGDILTVMITEDSKVDNNKNRHQKQRVFILYSPQ